ncbi:hypothetical protein [Reinekea thalattae]|uniref:Uncharacterized protein n=1 Tax=Reinekea thalattae TaxID=2593301 RepID=A0A5C8Z164_9GAMM|nr:hypothetical protein [Reinekea thalattae]TXR51892.1 hypothetical protein FME95_10725 [Reinekea thalattae]
MVSIGAVVTGDIINSTGLSDTDHRSCLVQLEQSMLTLNQEFAVQGDIYRGDEFQVFIAQPQFSLRIAVLLRLALMQCVKRSDARVAIGIGHFNQLEPELRKTAKGEAFVLSGRALKAMDEQRLTVNCSSRAQINPSHQLLIQYLDFVLTALSHKQAEVLYPRLLYPALTQQLLAEKTAINRRSLASRLQRANADIIIETLALYEAVIADKLAAIDS